MNFRLVSFACALCLLPLAACAPASTIVVQSGDVSQSEALVVSGEADVERVPDRARVTLGVEAKADTAEAAIADATTRAASLRAALLKLGLPEAHLRTSNYSVYQEREELAPPPPPVLAPVGGKGPQPVPPPQTPRFVERTRVTLNVEVLIDQLSLVGKVLGEAANAGSNTASGLSFELRDSKPAEADARAAAIADARSRAEQLAKLSGVKLGRVLQVVDGGASVGGPAPYGMPMMAKASAGPVPVDGGTLKLHGTVRVVFAIAR